MGKESAAVPPPKRHSARVLRVLRKREPKLIESTKKCLVLKGHHTNEVISDVLRDIAQLNKPHSVVFSKKNEVLPFEDANSIEFFGQKNDCSLFAVGSHTKKRPSNLILGRTFDGHVLDMIEFGVDAHSAIASFPGSKKAVGSKPMFVFVGSQWETDSLYNRIENLLLDFFRGVKLDKLSLQGIDHVIACTVSDGKIYFRVYSVAFRKSGTKVPLAKLSLMGPSLDLTVRRSQLASDDMRKASLRQPKAVKEVKQKNIKRSLLGDKVGRIHMEKQHLDKMGGRRVTALRGDRDAKAVVEDAAASGAPVSQASKKAARRGGEEQASSGTEKRKKRRQAVEDL